VLTAVRLGKPVAQCGHALYPNAERHLRLRMRLAQLYPPELLAETVAIAGRCRFSLDSLKYEYPSELVPPGHTPASWLRSLTGEGLRWRFPAGVPQKVAELVEHELRLVSELGYEPFFLTVHDVVRFARGEGILCQGRGSAANSVVCYALGITEVDPARMNVLFERFVSRERNEPPDIDVDFEHQRREEVIQSVYRKYGRERAALAATVICYRPKSAVRDAGKALGLSLEEVDRLAKGFAFWDTRIEPTTPVLEFAAMLRGFPRHLSQHVGGFVISRGPLAELVPIENAAMPGRTVIQWDKDDLEALGLLKVDVLALGMLSAIRRCLEMVGKRMHEIPAEDPAVYAMIQKADTVGVFQIESRAQMSMLPRLKPESFYDLVIEVAIVRPGPIQGGMVARIGAGRLSELRGEEGPRKNARRADLPGAGDGARDGRRRLHARRGRSPAPLDGRLEALRQSRSVRGQAEGGDAPERLQRGVRRFDLPADPRLRRVRFPRIAFGQLRAARLCLFVAQASPPGGVLRSAAQQPADGLLRAGAAGPGRAPPRGRGAPARCERERLGLHARGRRAAPGAAHGERIVRSRRAAHRAGQALRLDSLIRTE
jgi:hypothetical protein